MNHARKNLGAHERHLRYDKRRRTFQYGPANENGISGHSQRADNSRSIGHGDILYSARLDSCGWRLRLAIWL
jgi:hypothetical protein